jgi:hypothetical protein
LPKYSTPTPKIDIDNKARFRYQVGYWFGLLDVSICGARDDADTQLTVFDSSALKKQLPIFYLFEVVPRMDTPVDPQIVDGLYGKFVEFRRAYDENGMTIDEFDHYGPNVRTLRQFIDGYHALVGTIRDLMLPNPDI